jgi:lysophospholipase L1-like esterase
VIFLAVGEFVMRRVFPVNPESRWSQHHFRVGALGIDELNDIMEPDPNLFWRVKPNLKNQFITGFVGTQTLLHFKVDTDENGFRMMERSAQGDSIIFLGDSCLFGMGVRADESCPALVGERLGVKARNLSCPGYTLFQGRRLLARMGWDPEPRALVAAFGFNDRLMWDGLTDPEHASLLSKRASFLGRHSRLFYCLELAIEGSLKLLEKKPDKTSRRMPPELFKTEADILVRDAKARGVPVIFLFWPRIEWMMEEGAGHPYADVIRDLADGERVFILDLAEAFRLKGGEALYLDGIHPKPEGHAIAADRLVELLDG